MPFARTLGLELITNRPDEVRCRLEWSDAARGRGRRTASAERSWGSPTAGGGICAALNLPEGATGTTTIESKTNFLRAVRSGRVEAVSRPLHAGRSVIVVETDVIDAEGRLVARVTQSQIVLRA